MNSCYWLDHDPRIMASRSARDAARNTYWRLVNKGSSPLIVAFWSFVMAGLCPVMAFVLGHSNDLRPRTIIVLATIGAASLLLGLWCCRRNPKREAELKQAETQKTEAERMADDVWTAVVEERRQQLDKCCRPCEEVRP